MMIQRNLIPELFGYLNDAADLLEDTPHYEVILNIMKEVYEQATGRGASR